MFYSDSWALLIGINNYHHDSKLDNAVADAEAMQKLLTNKLDKATKLAVEEAKGNNLDIIRRIGILEERLKSGKISQSQYDDGVNSLLTKSDTLLESAKDLAQA